MVQRGGGRVALALDVAAKVSGFPQPIAATVVDLSIHGCRMTARSVFLLNSEIEFTLTLPKARPIAIRGKINRCTPTEASGTLEYGVEFGPLAAQDKSVVAAFIEEASTHESSARNTMRIETEFPVECQVQNQKAPVAGIAIDIGQGGMRIACDNALPEGSNVAIRFVLPGDVNGKQLLLRGRIVHRKQQFREYHHNIAFTDGDAKQIERIAHFMRSQN